MIGSRIGRIRIDALLGEGGMGEVYRGYDEVLERVVAVKTIRPEKRLGEEAKARFLREARLLSRLDHPNICRVYDLLDLVGSEYLVLEFIDGRSLREIPPDELDHAAKLAIAEKVAEVLAAAHGEGIVHRDLKPENVMLTADGEVKVLDFGIARTVRGESREGARRGGDPAPHLPADAFASELETAYIAGPARPPSSTSDAGRAEEGEELAGTGASLTRCGSVVGTLHFMSPEQAAGLEVEPPSDLYSFGVLLQELFTERPAYPPVAQPDLLARVQRGETLPIAGIEPELAGLIADLESPDPAARPNAVAARERIRAIRARPRRRRRRRNVALLAALVVALLAVTGIVSYRLSRPEPLLPAGEAGRVALLPFVNATGDARLDWVRHGLQQLVAETLAATPGIDVVPPQDVFAALAEHPAGTQGDAPLGDEMAQRIAATLGSNLLVETRVEKHGARFELLYRVRTPGGAGGFKSVGGDEPTAAANALAAHLALRIDPTSRAPDLRDRFSEDPDANRTYAMGLERLQTLGPKAAEPYFSVALDRDPEFLWAELRLAQVEHDLGSTEKSDEVLARVLAAARERHDARLLAATLLRLGTAALERGEYERAERQLQAALDAARGADDAYAVLEATNNLATSAYYRGALDRAEALYREVRERSAALGFRFREAAAINNLGGVAYQRDDRARAEELWQQALARFRELGNRVQEGRILANLAVLAGEDRDLARAETYERQALAAYREAGYRRGLPTVLFNLSETVADGGRYEEAGELVASGLAISREIEDRYAEAHLLAAESYLEARRGELEQATRSLAEAATVARELGSPAARAEIAPVRAYLLLRQHRLEAAVSALREAETAKPGDSEVAMLRARYEYERGHLQAALATAEKAAALPDVWSTEMAATLAVYRRAAALGRRLPLPDEAQR